MNWYLAAAGTLTFLVGLVHSVLGEILIFSRMHRRGVVPTDGGQLLLEQHVRILWASWHVVTVFGWGMAALLLWLAVQSSHGGSLAVVTRAVAASMLVGSALVLVSTKGRHPGWIGLLLVAVLTWLGQPA